MAHNLARWTARIGLGEQVVTTKTLRRRFFSLAGPHPLGAPPHFASATALALGKPVQSRPGTIARPAISNLTAPVCHHTPFQSEPPTSYAQGLPVWAGWIKPSPSLSTSHPLSPLHGYIPSVDSGLRIALPSA